MAQVKRQPQARNEFKATCDIPACIDRRAARGQASGRFLGTIAFEGGVVTVTLKCSECGATHAITLQIPPDALAKFNGGGQDDA